MQHFGDVKITEIHVSNKKIECENTHIPKKNSFICTSFSHQVFVFKRGIIKYCVLVHKLRNKNILFIFSELPVVPLKLVLLLTRMFFYTCVV